MTALLLAALLTTAPAAVPGQLVERRLLVKEGRVLLTVGGAWLERDDHYLAPGAMLSVGYFPNETYGFELKGAYMHSWLDASASEVVEKTGLQPDARRPRGLALLGYRRSFAYGKVLIAGQVLHFDLHGSAAGGLTFTDGPPAPTAMFAPSLLLRFTERVHAQLELGVGGALEKRREQTFAPLLLPSLSIGVML